MFKRKKDYLIPVLGFLLIIFIGGLVLNMPFCKKEPISLLDTVFISTSSITTTGFDLNDISSNYTFLGHIIISILMNVGAISIILLIDVILRYEKIKKYKSDKCKNYEKFKLKKYLKEVIKYVLIIEIIGAFFLAFKFIPEYGVIKGVWYSIFHSISAFSNTGFDLFGEKGLTQYSNDIYVRLIFILLMIFGGIGFIPIKDIIENKIKRKGKLEIQSKVVIIYFIVIILISTVGIKILEGKNISWLNALFMGTTIRNTGLYTVNITNMRIITIIVILLLMVLGGAPGSTAGGIKVVVYAVVEAMLINLLVKRKDVILFKRKINQNTIRLSVIILFAFIIVLLISTTLLLWFNDFGLFNIIFLCVSGISSTGLVSASLGLLNNIGKFIIIILMFIGRIGPLSILAIYELENNGKNIDFQNEELIL